MLRYNISNWGGPRACPDVGPAAAIVAAGETRVALSSRRDRPFAFGLVSILLHAVLFGWLLTVVTPPLAAVFADQQPVEFVFEQSASPSAPVAAEEPEPRSQATEPPPAPAPEPLEPQPSSPRDPEPSPLPEAAPPPPPQPELPSPEPAPVRPPPPKPKPPAVRRAPPKPAEQTPGEGSATRIGPPSREPMAPPAAPVVDRGWLTAVSGWLTARKIYPEQARQRGDEGNVSIRFTVDRSGRVVEALVVASSGSALLDEAALRLSRNAVLPAFPVEMTQARITITTTIRYSLR